MPKKRAMKEDVMQRLGPFRQAFMAAIVAMILAAVPAAANEGQRLAWSCAGCHGTAGAAPGHTIPILGGQSAVYLAETLRAYKSGERNYYVMNIIANGFDDAAIDAIALWFEAQPWIDTPTAHDHKRAATAPFMASGLCATCHGADGTGTPAGPRIAGQPAAYLALALRAYRDNLRVSATARVAKIVMGELTDSDIDALAHYYAGLR